MLIWHGYNNRKQLKMPKIARFTLWAGLFQGTLYHFGATDNNFVWQFFFKTFILSKYEEKKWKCYFFLPYNGAQH